VANISIYPALLSPSLCLRPSSLRLSLSFALSKTEVSLSLETHTAGVFAMQALEQQFLDERPTNVPLFIHTVNPLNPQICESFGHNLWPNLQFFFVWGGLNLCLISNLKIWWPKKSFFLYFKKHHE
jgi:hypothetical protein